MNHPPKDPPNYPPKYWPGRLVIYAAFAGTGVGMALPGAVLPALIHRWSLTDSQAGFFFFVGWLGTSLGALFVQRSRTASLAAGCALAALGAAGIAWSSGWLCYAAMAAYGLGLGLMMTATSLLQVARNIERRAMELNRLNLIWAIGACIGPSLALHSLRVASVRSLFSALAAFFFAAALWITLLERDAPAAQDTGAALHASTAGFDLRRLLTLWPLAIVAVILLPTGIEASMGAWISAYVRRAGQTIATTVTAGTCFWIGLMVSRIVVSVVLSRRRWEKPILAQSLVTVVAGMLLLIATTNTLGILPGVFLIGYGLGPVYPLILAVALQYSEQTAIFFVAGLGSASLPWLTGVVSSATLSLRLGLLVPLAASVAMLALGLRIRPPARQPLPAVPAADSVSV